MNCPIKVRHKSNFYGVFFMTKFSVAQKLQVVERYASGYESYKTIATSMGMSVTSVRKWVRIYEANGAKGLEKGYTTYSLQFKMDVLNFMSETGASLLETASTFNIPSPTRLTEWRRLYETGGIEALESKKKERPMKKQSKQPSPLTEAKPESIEALQAKVRQLEMENAYLKKLKSLVQEQEKLQTRSKRK